MKITYCDSCGKSIPEGETISSLIKLGGKLKLKKDPKGCYSVDYTIGSEFDFTQPKVDICFSCFFESICDSIRLPI